MARRSKTWTPSFRRMLSRTPPSLPAAAAWRCSISQQYGATRWEAWAPAAQNRPPQQQQTCTGPTTMTYQGMAFTLVDCRDWSTTVLLSAGWEHPVWPVPDLNRLSNFHFATSLTSWTKAGPNTVASPLHSKAPIDTQAGAGVSYLSARCCGVVRSTQVVY